MRNLNIREDESMKEAETKVLDFMRGSKSINLKYLL